MTTRPGPQLTVPQIAARNQRVLDLHRAGLSLSAIAAKIGRDTSVVSRILKRLDPTSSHERTPAQTERNAKIVEMSAKGVSLTLIAKEFGISPARTANLIARAKRRAERQA